jgi:regulator of sigma E protease
VGFNFNSIWLTLLMLSVAVMIHEYGHFLTARSFGVTVYEFSLGFGPLIGKFTRGGVQYSLRWILFGGFCKIAGMDMALEGETKEPETRPEHIFYNLSLWKKVIVLATGSIFNLILGMIVFFGALIWIGAPVVSHGALVSDSVVISTVNQKSPALEAGFKPGDKLVAVNDKPIKQSTDLSDVVQKAPNQVLRIQINRNGTKLIKALKAKYSPENKKYLIGVSLMVTPKFKTASFNEAAKQTVSLPWTTIKMLVKLIKGKVKGTLMGPIGAVDMIEQTLQLPPQLVWFSMVQFFAAISISLCLFNLLPLPLPILDGGWIVILILEKIFRREFSAKQKAAAYTIGLLAVLCAFVWITYGDVLRLVKRVLGG